MLDLSPSCALLLQFFIYAIYSYSKRLVGDSLGRGRDDLVCNVMPKIVKVRSPSIMSLRQVDVLVVPFRSLW